MQSQLSRGPGGRRMPGLRQPPPAAMRAARQASNYTQQDAAGELGVVPPVLRGYEAGRKTPSLRVFLAMADLYGVEVDALCDRRGS